IARLRFRYLFVLPSSSVVACASAAFPCIGRNYRIHISQLSVIGAAKVSHFEILCRVYGFEPTVGLFRCFYVNSKNKGWMSFSKCQGNDSICYTKPLDSLKSWNDHFFWVDAFACPASFSWNTSKSVSKDPFPKSSEFNEEHYATLVAYPAPFQKYPEPFLCLIGISRNYTLDEYTYPQFLRKNEMDLISFIRTADPTKVRVGKRQRVKNEPKLLDMLQGDFASGGQGAGIQFVSEAAKVVAEDVAPLQPRRQRKHKIVIIDAGEPSHLAKKLRDDHDISTGPSVASKSRSAIHSLLAGAVLNSEVRIVALPTLPFVTSSVSVTPEHKGGDETDSVAGANLRTISAPQRFVISSDSSHHSGANVAEAEVDSVVKSSVPVIATVTTVTATVDATTVAKEALIKPSLFSAGSSSAGGTDPTPCDFSDVSGSDVTNGSHLDDGRVCREMLDEFAPPNFFASIRAMEHDQLFTEFNVGAARQISLSAEVRMRAEYNIKEKRRLRSVVDEKTELLKARDGEIENLKA
ncbi:hypothetical protein Tco_0672417, partial [Tanacetum coccineum]